MSEAVNTATPSIEGAADVQFLIDAVSRGVAAVLSLPSAGMYRNYKSRFLAESPEGIWVQSQPTETPLVNQLIATETPVGLAFKGPHLRMIFKARPQRRNPAYALNAESTVDALLVAWPKSMQAVQRRRNYRAQAAPATGLLASVWRIPERADLRDRPHSTAKLAATLRDLSTGGLGMLCHKVDSAPVKLLDGERLRVLLKYEQMELLLEGRCCFLQSLPDGSLKCGVNFPTLESDLAGRQSLAVLSMIVGQLQRDEVRRLRLAG